MDEQKDKMGDERQGSHGWCPWCWGSGDHRHHHWHPGFFLLRILIAIIVIAFAFAVGVKLGEIRASYYYAGYGGNGYAPLQYMMGGGWDGWYGQGYGSSYGPYGAPPMMRYYYNYGAPVPGAQTAPAPTSTGK